MGRNTRRISQSFWYCPDWTRKSSSNYSVMGANSLCGVIIGGQRSLLGSIESPGSALETVRPSGTECAE